MDWKNSSLVHAAVAGCLVCLFNIVPVQAGGEIVLVSKDSAGSPGNHYSRMPTISADGRFVTFYSAASNLVPDDTNGYPDVFLHDRETGTTWRISRAWDGGETDRGSFSPVISADGRYVVFYSAASNLVPGDTNGVEDVFLYERSSGQVERISRAWNRDQPDRGSFGPRISADGSLIVFYSYATNLVQQDVNDSADIFLYNRQTDDISLTTRSFDGGQANGPSYWPAISPDGEAIVYYSSASNLVAGDENGKRDIFVYTVATGETERVSIGSNGQEADGDSFHPGISNNGQWVVFESESTNLVAGDSNHRRDIFLHDRFTGTTELVSGGLNGQPADGSSYWPGISNDGRFIVYESEATNLVVEDSNHARDIFLFDRTANKTESLSRNESTGQANDASFYPAISYNGKLVTFFSYATNLVNGDNNGLRDIFVGEQDFCNLSFPLRNEAWQLVSLPCRLPVDSNTVAACFGDDIDGAYGQDWIMYRYDADQNIYVNMGVNGVLEPGEGYWIMQRTGSDVALRLPAGSMPVEVGAEDSCPSDKGCYAIPLTARPGAVQWNLIGYTETIAQPYAAARIDTSAGDCASGCDPESAASHQIFQSTLWGYDGSSYVSVDPDGYLDLWRGYWGAALPEADGLDPVLLVPRP